MKPSELCTCLVVSCFCFSGESLKFFKRCLPTWTRYFSIRLARSVERREITNLQPPLPQDCTTLGRSWRSVFLSLDHKSWYGGWRGQLAHCPQGELPGCCFSGCRTPAVGLPTLALGGEFPTCGFHSDSLAWKTIQDKSCQKRVSFLAPRCFQPARVWRRSSHRSFKELQELSQSSRGGNKIECKSHSAPGEHGKRVSSPPLAAAGFAQAAPWPTDVCV